MLVLGMANEVTVFQCLSSFLIDGGAGHGNVGRNSVDSGRCDSGGIIGSGIGSGSAS